MAEIERAVSRICVNCRYWSSKDDEMNRAYQRISPIIDDGARVCLNKSLKAAGIHSETGFNVPVVTFADFGCVQFDVVAYG